MQGAGTQAPFSSLLDAGSTCLCHVRECCFESCLGGLLQLLALRRGWQRQWVQGTDKLLLWVE